MASSLENREPLKPALPRWARVGLFLVLYAVLSLAGHVGLMMATTQFLRSGAMVSTPVQPPGLMLGWHSTMALVLLGLTWVFWTRVDRRPWSEIGFSVLDASAWRRGLVLCLVFAIPSWALELGFGHVRWAGWAVQEPGQALVRSVLHAGSALAAAVSVELPFRGYVHGNFAGRMSDGRVVLITAVLYTVGHLWLDYQRDLLNVVDALLTGAAFAYLRLAGGSLALPVAVTAISYFSTLLIGPDLWMEPLASVTSQPPNLWFGNEWYAGLKDIWLTLLWLTGIYAWVYRPRPPSQS